MHEIVFVLFLTFFLAFEKLNYFNEGLEFMGRFGFLSMTSRIPSHVKTITNSTDASPIKLLFLISQNVNLKIQINRHFYSSETVEIYALLRNIQSVRFRN
jgi:hypothetical protein